MTSQNHVTRTRARTPGHLATPGCEVAGLLSNIWWSGVLLNMLFRIWSLENSNTLFPPGVTSLGMLAVSGVSRSWRGEDISYIFTEQLLNLPSMFWVWFVPKFRKNMNFLNEVIITSPFVKNYWQRSGNCSGGRETYKVVKFSYCIYFYLQSINVPEIY